jgi:DNA-binding transcriptional regulator GbsR (MarR family)
VNRSVAQIHAALYLSARPDHFKAEADPWEIMLRIAQERKKREIDPALSMLRDCVNDTDQNTSADPVVRERLRSMLTFLDDLTSWYEQVRKLPRPTLTAIIKLGGKIGGFFHR